MSKLKVPQLLQQAEQHHKTGDFARMEALCKEILAIRQDVPKVWYLIALASRADGRKEEAVEMLQKSLALFPDSANVLADLGLTLVELGRIDEAVAPLQKARTLQPNSPEVCFAYGKALLEQKKFAEAETVLKRAAELNPRAHEAQLRLGNAYRGLGRTDQALAAYVAATRIKPDYADAFINYGATLVELGQVQEGVAAYQQALQANPKSAIARNNLGAALNQLGRWEDAVAQLKAAIELDPNHAKAHNNLANALRASGAADESLVEFKKATELAPGNPTFASNAVFALNYVPAIDGGQRLLGAKQWAQRFADGFTAAAPAHANDRNPDRRLRIGYFCPDLRIHALCFQLEAVLRRHDTAQVESVCYVTSRPDELTQRLRPHVALWREIGGQSDDAAAAAIREDRIDILVDLALHSNGHRLLVAARKPAPVQVTWLGYPGTTGMQAFDYRLTDPILDPQGNDELYSERSLRLPETYAVYAPMAEMNVSPLPAAASGVITFGSLHSMMKINEHLAMLWGAVLKHVPKSKLLLAADGPARRRIAAWFAKQGLGGDRVEIIEHPKSRNEQLATFARIDIGLDSYPFAGGTTVLDALWMGVPTITFAGRDAISRTGVSIAANMGLGELLTANSPQEFVAKAAQLTANPERLNAFRQQVRARMEKSPLMDYPKFARQLEAAYRQMWRAWCQR